jgi:hypothetical protein
MDDLASRHGGGPGLLRLARRIPLNRNRRVPDREDYCPETDSERHQLVRELPGLDQQTFISTTRCDHSLGLPNPHGPIQNYIVSNSDQTSQAPTRIIPEDSARDSCLR